MKTAGLVVGGVIMLTGMVWFLQGVGILPGSFMTGQAQWAVYGALAVLAGLGLVVMAHRRGGQEPTDRQ
jgi:hypothetical protein